MNSYVKNIFNMKVSVKKSHTAVRGFSLLEVIVTMVIFGIMMSISFSNYPRLTAATAFNNAAQEIVSITKSAQITGSSRGGSYGGDGVYFAIGDKTNFIEFSDIIPNIDLGSGVTGVKKGDKVFSNNLTPAPDDLDLTKITKIQSNISISDLCVKNSTGTISCNTTPGGPDNLSISFIRPSVEANISDMNQIAGKYDLYDKGYVELYQHGTSKTDYKCMIVYRYGQIDLKSGKCTQQN
jgi:prepilin-type N-terminal cleavage/methylation domain-containing protein